MHLGIGGSDAWMEADVSPQTHDTILRAMGEVFVGMPLAILGLELPPVVGLVSPDLPELTVRDHTADTVWNVGEGEYVHPEYQSTPVSRDDLLRFAQYDLLLCRRDGCRVHTVVVYTKAVAGDACEEVDFGSFLYRPHVVHLARLDGDAVLEALGAKVRAGGGLDGEEEIRLVLSCVMGHEVRTAEKAAHEALDLARTIPQGRRREICIAAIGGFGAKVLDDEALTRLLRRVADMTKAAEVLRNMGRAEGREEGRAEGRAEGWAEGREEGRAEGREEGRAEGELRRARAWLVKVFALRLGPVPEAVRQAVTGARDLETLEQWLEVVAKAGDAAEAERAILGAR